MIHVNLHLLLYFVLSLKMYYVNHYVFILSIGKQANNFYIFRKWYFRIYRKWGILSWLPWLQRIFPRSRGPCKHELSTSYVRSWKWPC